MSSTRIFTHPLREGITQILEKHFAPEIVKRFKLIFEAQIYQGDFILNQKRNDKVAMEVHFDNGKSTEYVCDVWSWISPKQAEVQLLKYITDKVKQGKFGANWIESEDGRISEEVASGKYETPDKLITDKMKGGEGQ